MPKKAEPNVSLADVPANVLKNILHFLPQFSLAGQHAAHTVCQQWNNLLKESPRKNEVVTSKQLVSHIQTESEAMLFLDNTRVFDEMDYKSLLRIAVKIPKVRDAIIPGIKIRDLCAISKYDIDVARYFIESDEHQLDDEDKLFIRSFHETLCNQYLDQQNVNADEARILSKTHISIAKRILNSPDIYLDFTEEERIAIIALHTELVEENLEACGKYLDVKISAEGLVRGPLHQFLTDHSHSRIVANFLVKRYKDLILDDIPLLAIIAKNQWDIACQLIDEVELARILNFRGTGAFVKAHFDMAKKYITHSHVIFNPDHHETLLGVIISHFPDSKCFLLDETYQLGAVFYKEYGPILALPRMQRVLLNPSSSNYDFKVALMHSLFEHPEYIEHIDDEERLLLASLIDDINSADLAPMIPAIAIFFENEEFKNSLVPLFALKLFSRLPFELSRHLMDEAYITELVLKPGKSVPSDYFDTYFLHNPVLSRKIMSNTAIFDLLPKYMRTEIVDSLAVRDLIKQTVQNLKQEENSKEKAPVMKP